MWLTICLFFGSLEIVKIFWYFEEKDWESQYVAHQKLIAVKSIKLLLLQNLRRLTNKCHLCHSGMDKKTVSVTKRVTLIWNNFTIHAAVKSWWGPSRIKASTVIQSTNQIAIALWITVTVSFTYSARVGGGAAAPGITGGITAFTD